MPEIINRFSGRYHFLSNFSAAEVWYQGESYPSVEHAYQASKTEDYLERRTIQTAATPNLAKRIGRSVNLRKDFEVMKTLIMYDLVRQKFRQHPELSEKLLATGDAVLIEGNWWGDTFWGVCDGQGENHLGRILMEVREELKARIDDAT
jgi:ribA/ribD-fused uncharacterized protein